MPKVQVVLPRALMSLFGSGPTEITMAADTITTLLNELDTRWPGMADRLRDSRPAIRRHINIFVGGNRADLQTPLNAGDKVFVLTAMSGG